MDSKPNKPENKVGDFIQIWKTSNAKAELEMETFRTSREYQDALVKIKNRNGERGTKVISV